MVLVMMMVAGLMITSLMMLAVMAARMVIMVEVVVVVMPNISTQRIFGALGLLNSFFFCIFNRINPRAKNEASVLLKRRQNFFDDMTE